MIQLILRQDKTLDVCASFNLRRNFGQSIAGQVQVSQHHEVTNTSFYFCDVIFLESKTREAR